ncbi:MAG: HEAT repeat domain-containing protein [Saprospirales bacterium]|nr:HEAT repeat domain-containing protein [Saprospirales bacterium]
MKKQLKQEIEKFKKWSRSLSEIPEPERGGEWEENYTEWCIINELFYEFIATENYLYWENEDIEYILYLIARNNETEDFIEKIAEQQPKSLELLANKSLEFGERDSKWQIAINLDKFPNKEIAKSLLERFLKDGDEYVRRMALMTISKFNHSRLEEFCKEAWNREDKWQEYQRIAVLHSLETANSPELEKYFKLAIEDGRQYLIMNVNKLKGNKNEV